MSFLVTAILGVILAGVGGVLIVSLSGPLNSLKDMFVAFINLICNNAIWFIFFVLLFVIVVSLLKKIKPFEIKSLNQQRVNNNMEKQRYELEKQKINYDYDIKNRDLKLQEKTFKEAKKNRNDWRNLSKWITQNHLI